MNKIILVHYIGSNLSSNEFHQAVDQIQQKLKAGGLRSCYCYFLPTKGESRVECINPKLVDEKAFEEARLALERHKEIIQKYTEELNSL
jgi:hypothetical protein